jgi:hypothetical protein
MGRPIVLWACLFAGSTTGPAEVAEAKVLHSKEGAFQLAFPEAESVEPLHLFLEDAQEEEIERRCGAKVPSRLVTVYVAKRQGQPYALGVIETHRVRTLSETLLVVLDLSGRIAAVHLLAFHEPDEYQPPRAWLRQFERRRLSRDLVVGRDIAGIAGASLTAQAVTEAIRRILALFEVVLGPAIPVRPLAGR